MELSALNHLKNWVSLPMRVSVQNKIKASLNYLPKSRRMSSLSTIKTTKYLRFYLIYKCSLNAGKKHRMLEAICHSMHEVEPCISHYPVFLEAQQAVDYILRKGKEYGLLEAYIPETAIIGHCDGDLAIKHGSVSNPQIACYYPDPHNLTESIKNDNFDKNLLNYLSEPEELL